MPVLPRNGGRRHLRADEGEAEDGGDAYADSGDDMKLSDAEDSSTGSYAEDDSSNGQEAMSTRFLVDHVDEVISVNGVADQIPPNAFQRTLSSLGRGDWDRDHHPGDPVSLTGRLARPSSSSCYLASSNICDDDNIRNRAITLEDLFSRIRCLGIFE